MGCLLFHTPRDFADAGSAGFHGQPDTEGGHVFFALGGWLLGFIGFVYGEKRRGVVYLFAPGLLAGDVGDDAWGGTCCGVGRAGLLGRGIALAKSIVGLTIRRVRSALYIPFLDQLVRFPDLYVFFVEVQFKLGDAHLAASRFFNRLSGRNADAADSDVDEFGGTLASRDCGQELVYEWEEIGFHAGRQNGGKTAILQAATDVSLKGMEEREGGKSECKAQAIFEGRPRYGAHWKLDIFTRRIGARLGFRIGPGGHIRRIIFTHL